MLIKVKVKIQTFKESGKFYDEWYKEFEIENPIAWYELIKKIKKLKKDKILPQSDLIYVVSEDLCGNFGFPHMIN